MPPRKPAATPATTTTAAKATASKTAAVKKPAAAPKATKVAATASAAKKAPAVKKVPVKAAAQSVKAITERFSKTDLLNHLTQATALTRKDVNAVLEELTNVIEGHIKKRGCGEFTIPGLLKIVTVKKPATKARKGISPFSGEEIMFKAKPASIAVKIRPLKKLKDMAL
ncbi:MAG: HU family DNA-binding protein [Marinagarivorans sp.]|nr:HU family DNA-binding protein [Marinagarivorans sp.]